MLDSLTLAALSYPEIDPVLVNVFGFPIRWYSLAYISGLLLGWLWMRRTASVLGVPITRMQVDDFLMWATLGVILGGRLGYILFYKPAFYLSHPLEALQLWDGGMSFHGGLVGVTLGIILFARRNGIDLYRFADLVASAVPLGLLFGRIANFINGELWGRATDLSWAMVFPRDPLALPRHPSQLYEAALEGLALFMILNWLIYRSDIARRYPGSVVGAFFTGYGVFRFLVEYAREPDAHLGLISGFISMGQILSLPMILFGLYLIRRAGKAGPVNHPAGRVQR